MSQQAVQTISCDHRPDCDNTPVVQSTIRPVEPYYHIKLEISVIDAQGTIHLVSVDQDVCRWHCWPTISDAHDVVVNDLERRKESSQIQYEDPLKGSSMH